MFLHPIFLSHVVNMMPTCHLSMSTCDKQVCRIISRSRWDIVVGGGPFSFSCSCIAFWEGETKSGIPSILSFFRLFLPYYRSEGEHERRRRRRSMGLWIEPRVVAVQLPSNKRRPPRESWEKPPGFLDAFAVPSGYGRFLDGRENLEKPASQWWALGG